MSRLDIGFIFIIVIQLLFGGSRSLAQAVCGNPQLTDDQVALQEKRLGQRKNKPSARLAAQIQYIPIRFHVVRQSDGTGGVDMTSLNRALVLLNQVYQPINIAFYLCGTQPHYIDNTVLFDYDNTEESILADGNDVPNAINIYLPNTVSYGGGQVSGYSYFPSSRAMTNRLFVKASQVTTNTLSHELGHYFNLYHTFQGNRSSNVASRELVIRPGEPQQSRPFPANCTSAGDFVYDTPADPYGIPGATISGCTYSGTITDANGDSFQPMMSNIMSYYLTCDKVSTFTPGQYTRLAEGLDFRLDPSNEYTLNCAGTLQEPPTNLTVSSTKTGVQLQFLYAGNDAAGFFIERSLEPTANFTVVGSLPPDSYVYVDGSVVANTTYYYRIKASNASTHYSAVQTITTGLIHCIPTYTWPVANFTPKIDDFILTGSQSTLRSIATGAGKDGYSDFTTIEHNVVSGRTYSFTASAVTGNSGSFINQHLTIWLDSNRDGLFSSTEVLFQSSASQLLNPSLTSTISIPASMPIGPAQLRLRSRYAPNGLAESPCDPYSFGEAEDYTLIISGPTPPACFSLIASATPVQCTGNSDGTVSLSVLGGTAPFSYSVANLSNSTGTFINLPAGNYRATVTDANACNLSVNVTITEPAMLSASLTGTTVVCGTRAVALNVSVSGENGPYALQLSDGLTVRAITNYVSNTPISVSPDNTTQYQLLTITDAKNCPVSLVKASAIVTVNPINQAVILPGSASVCSGQALTLTASQGSQYVWSTGQTSAQLAVMNSGTYSVTITSAAGCTSTAAASVLATPCIKSVLFRSKVLLEGFIDANTGLMHSLLALRNLLPKQQPFSAQPWLYTGPEQVTDFPANVTDWVLVMARNASNVVIAQKAAFIRNDGILIDLDGTEGILFTAIPEPVYMSIHHRSHLAILSANEAIDNQLVDFTTDATAARGTQPFIQIGSKLAMYSGDYDANGVINSTDYNKWKINASAVGRYLSIDGDGNGIVNNQDFNKWTLNRSKIGIPGL